MAKPRDKMLPIQQQDEQNVQTIMSEDDSDHKLKSSTKTSHKSQLVYRNIILMTLLHGLAIYGVCVIPNAKIVTLFWVWMLLLIGAVGVQTGAHRLWSHQAYQANFGLRVFLAMCHVLALQDDLFTWCRDHRAHHKYSDTDADPHNSTR